MGSVVCLACLHALNHQGRITCQVRDRFTLFIGWLGGPQDYMVRYGHPRLRMRHSHIPINTIMRDTWLRCMNAALEAEGIQEPVLPFLQQHFAEVAVFCGMYRGNL
ncbi:MAG: hypothetical protein RMJ98_19765 [Myxococcales bacterium]|nr:hypothetical protein [Myxococcales bacterium]